MKWNTYRWKKISKWLAAAGLFLCLLLTTVPVFAEEAVTTAAATETDIETEEKTESDGEIQTLPEGNLTLVDDVITAGDAHREFLTVITKDGSYFYLVVDRDTQGAGNVYFLNLVDNQDLYKLTGEKAPAARETETAIKPDPEPQTQEVEHQEEEMEASEEESARQKQKSLMITVGVGAAVIVGLVIYLLKKRRDKKVAKAEYDLSDFDDDEE